MNQNGDEKRIRQLFHELSFEDLNRAPEFATVLAASKRQKSSGSSVLWWPVKVAAAAIMCVGLLIAYQAMRRGESQEPPQVLTATAVPSPGASSDVVRSSPEPSKRGSRPIATRRRHHAQFSSSLTFAIRSMSSWQSPTAVLLQSPRDEMLKGLPRLGESLQMIKTFSLDQFN